MSTTRVRMKSTLIMTNSELKYPCWRRFRCRATPSCNYFNETKELRITIREENRLSLSIDHLTLQKDEIGGHNNTRTFVGLRTAIEGLNCDTLNLSNVTFGYHPRPRNKEYTFPGRKVRPKNVSPEFLSKFFTCLTIDDLSMLHITEYSIPFIAQLILDRISYSHLILEDISFRQPFFSRLCRKHRNFHWPTKASTMWYNCLHFHTSF